MFDWLFGRKREPERVRQDVDAQITPSIEVEHVESPISPVSTEHLESQMEGLSKQIARLIDQGEALREQLDRLDHRASFGNEQLETLTQHLSDVADWSGPLDRRLAELVTWAEQSREALAQLEEGIRKLSRTQFKTNSLAEAQQERLQSALETLQDLVTRKQEAAEKARQQQREAVETARREARLAMAVDLFPALDGLEAALESGRALLDRTRQPAAKPGFLTRLAYAFGLHDLPTTPEDTHTLVAWLDGLELVRERFLALLRTEGIQPIRAQGQPFDPHHHVAVEAVERLDLPSGTVVEEHRPGYRLGDRVLRYAEVVVTRDEVEIRHRDVEPEALPVPELRAGDGEPIAGDESPARATWGTLSKRIDKAEREEKPGRPQAEEPEVPPMAAPEPRCGDGEAAVEMEERPLLASWGAPPEGIIDEAKESAVAEQAEQEPERSPETAEGPIRPALSEAEGTEEATVSRDVKDGTHRVDPEIEAMIARFEARQRAHGSG